MSWLKGLRKKRLEDYLNADEQQRITGAIRAAEEKTSGELRIHMEVCCPGNALERAAEVFGRLEMYRTAQRNGVLIYCALEDHKFALLGDSGIHEKVGDAFWTGLVARVQEAIRSRSLADGLCLACETIGQSLSEHFPRAADDVDELPDTLSFHP